MSIVFKARLRAAIKGLSVYRTCALDLKQKMSCLISGAQIEPVKEEDDEYDIEIKERKRLTEEAKRSQNDVVEETEIEEKRLD